MNGPISRMKSPLPGCSTLTTSAPISPSNPAQNGAAIRVPRSSTRKPSSGPLMTTCVSERHTVSLRYASRLLAPLLGADGVHAALLARLGCVQRGGGVADELVDHEVVPPRLPLPLEIEHPVDRLLHGLGSHRRDERNLVSHGACRLGELRPGDDLVDEPESLGVVGVDRLGAEQELLGLARSELPRLDQQLDTGA